ncbi:demethylmenaquinone methyltransferase [Corynebacterium choanae]|uniref:Demethylmenaquinone methyltransferase n=1 Tax=Corynebacterium choanae TaxID=1862358 RepID=A0A3G6J9L3_9CORY|nr:demethylmenaquinone methyltransferase [Corynebacterium choanae]AZA14453.1 Ubiquinone/menaquinone biosynthesis C-methyltransferase UbiE [Corynebacterium choanae]
MAKANLEKNPTEVSSMFDEVGQRYDITNTVLSLGIDRLWRNTSAARLAAQPGEDILDLAAGTAVSTLALQQAGAWPVACDFSKGMLRAGAKRDVVKVCGDGMNLPFADATFDAVTISFGLRNFQHLDKALAEIRRVIKPGGRLVITEFSTPTQRWFATAYDVYLKYVLTSVAKLVSSDPEAYLYLVESILAWPNQETLAKKMWDAGFVDVGWRNLTGGIVAIHAGEVPPAPQ